MIDRLTPDTIAARIRRVSAAQRARVAERLGVGTRDATRLVAYVVLAPDTDTPGDVIRVHLAHLLPEPVLPEVVVVDALPRTAAGKLDTRALADATAAARVKRPITPPGTSTELALVALWRELLPADRIGIDDNFFELGGHSLLATRLLSRVRATFGVDIGVRRLFETPTVAALGRAIEEARAAGVALAGASIAPLPRR